MDIKLHILMGLPGSGKTTFADELRQKLMTKGLKNSCTILSIDEIRSPVKYGKKVSLKEIINSEVPRVTYKETKDIIVDGPIFTNEDLFNMISTIARSFHKVTVTIYRWNEDRDTCLKNDGGRRELPSATTILHAEYEEVDIAGLNERIKDYDAEIINVVEKRVILKDGWDRYFRHMTYVSDDKKLRSDRWCNGGSYGSCWSNSLSPVSPDDPLEFDALDELLEKIAPNITFLHYKKIRSECVKTEETHERDYYGGGCSYLNWVCDLEKLYKLLEQQGYISE